MNQQAECEFSTQPYSVAFDGKGGANLLSEKEKFEPLEKNAFFWRNLDYKAPETFSTLVEKYGLAPDVVEALCDENTRPRFFRYGEGIVLILRGINYNQGSEPDDMVSLRVWIDKNKVITLSHRRLKIICNLCKNLEKEPAAKSPMQFILHLIEKMVGEINDFVIDISEATSDLEEKIIDIDALGDFEIRNEISNLRRKIITIRRYTAPQRDVFMLLQNEKWDLLTEEDRNDIREIYNDITKIIEDLDYCRDHLSVFHEELQSKMSISMTKTMYMISIVMVIFTPLTMLTGLLGINVRGIPYAESQYAFWGVCAVMVMISTILFFLMKRLRWL